MPIYKTGIIKDGKQQYRVKINYKDNNGNYKQKEKIVYGASEAKYKEQELLSQIQSNKDMSSITIYQLFQQYIDNKKYEVRETSLAKTETIIKNHVIPYFEKTKINKLDTPKLQNWKNQINQKNFSITTKKNIYSEFRAMLNYAVKMEYIQKNPIEKIGNFKEIYFEKPQDKLHYYTAEEFKKFISAAEKHNNPKDQNYYVFFNIAFYTGMRKGEINALKWTDIENDIIHVRRSIAQKIKGKSIIETPPKNKSSYRNLQIPKKLIKILAKHKKLQMKTPNFSEEFRVCGGPNCLSDTAISNKNTQYAKEAELPRIRIHDFRHSHASLLANEGINIQEIARRLGHSKIEMTWNTYSHLYPREEERAIKILDNI